MTYRLARSLEQLFSEVNTRFPNRSKASDGWIGDAAHASRDSDHNPWVKDAGVGVVTAVDITEDEAPGIPEISDYIVNTLVGREDPRVKYIIHESTIWRSYDKPGIPAWSPAPYGGSNQHFKHVHVSVQPEKVHYDSVAPWGIMADDNKEEFTMTPEEERKVEQIVEKVVTRLLWGTKAIDDPKTPESKDYGLNGAFHRIQNSLDRIESSVKD